jgi:type I restriction enzyme S subunit
MRAMKYSGAEWLGDIPQEWGITKIGLVYQERNEKVSDLEYPPLSVTMKGIMPQLDSAAKSADRDNRKRVKIGDFVINSRSDRRGSYGISQYDGSCSLINTVLEARPNVDTRYYNYVLFTKLFPDEYYRWGSGIVADLWSTRWEYMKRIILPKPPIEEQKKIVAILDGECGKIDSAIKDLEAVIDKLEILRSSIINEVTTRGLNKNRKKKPSGHEWIREIPVEWNMVYSKSLFALRKDRARDDDEQLTSSQKYGIIRQKDFMEREGRQVVQVVTGEEILKHVEAGDFVISMRSFQGGLEYSEISGKISSAYVMLIPRRGKVCSDYYKWLFKSKMYIRALQSTSNLVRDGQALRYSNFAQVYLPYFDMSEQTEIADFLNHVCGEIDKAIDSAKELTVKLDAYKKAIIYEYITGKRKVV